MSQQQISIDPPRIPSIQAVPTPQTCYGTLEHSGMTTSPIKDISNIPASIDWMPLVHVPEYTFVFSSSDETGKSLGWWHIPGGTPKKMHEYIPFWAQIPMTGAKWWNGTMSYKLMAIKPPRVTGKLLVRYVFGVNEQNFVDDKAVRGISKEWDLGQSNICEFDVNGINPVNARPTWLPFSHVINPSDEEVGKQIPYWTAASSVVEAAYSPGTLLVQVASRLQPGGIFPDSIRIVVFRYYKNTTFYSPTDFRADLPHFLLKIPIIGEKP